MVESKGEGRRAPSRRTGGAFTETERRPWRSVDGRAAARPNRAYWGAVLIRAIICLLTGAELHAEFQFRYNHRFNDDIFGMGDSGMLSVLKGIVASALLAFGVIYIFASSLDFQNCVYEYGNANPDAKYFKEGIPVFIRSIPIYRHCVGEYVTSKHDVITAVFTVVIALFTTVLALFTVSLAGSTRIAADAAKRAADAAVNVELPILIISHASLQVIPTGGTARNNLKFDENIPERFDPIIWFTNYGRSPAQVTAGCLQWQVATTASELPLPPKYSNIAPYPSNAVFKEDAFVRLDVPCVIEPKPCEILALNKSEKFLWVFGYITFRDFLDGPHESRFCLKWSRQREGSRGPFGFVWDSDTPSAYTKRT
jgi:hypothetical protein